MLFSVAEEMNPERRSTMEDAFSINGPGSWGAPNDGATFLGVYDGHGGRLIADYLEDHLAQNVAQEWAHAEGEGRKEGSIEGQDQSKKRRLGDENANGNGAPDSKSDHQKEGETMQIALERAFLLTDIQSRMDGLTTSGATVVCCIVVPKFTAEGRIESIVVHAANAGDARAVLSSRTARPALAATSSGGVEASKSAVRGKLPNPELPGESAVRITCDHKSTDDAEVKRIEAAGGMMMRGRVLGVLAVARSLGDHGLKEYVIGRPFLSSTVVRIEDSGSSSNNGAIDSDNGNDSDKETLQQSTQSAPYTDGEFLIVACDGLWDVMEDQEAVDLVRKFVGAKGSKAREEVAQFLIDESLRRGSTDNVTVIVYWL
ncbi:hypothetical protein ACHAXT_008186 [Thalassiosira profunda]